MILFGSLKICVFTS